MKRQKVKIMQVANHSMQSGSGGRINKWNITYYKSSKTTLDPIMGWNGNGGQDSILNQISIDFYSKEEAIVFAKNNNLDYIVYDNNNTKKWKPKQYANNFV